MMVGDPGDHDPTWIPSDSHDHARRDQFPTGTDPLYVALVDTFAHASFVMFGLANEPGGNTQPDATISAAMNHAVGIIRAEEDKLGVPHHLVLGAGQRLHVRSPALHDEPFADHLRQRGLRASLLPGPGRRDADNYKYSARSR